LLTLKEHNENNVTTIKQIYNAIVGIAGSRRGLNGVWTQFAINRNHQPRQKYITTDKAILYWFTQISWATSSSPLNKPFKRFHYSTNSYNEYTNLSKLQWVHKPLQVQVHKPLQVIPVPMSPWDQDHSRIKETLSKEITMKAHNGEELHNGFTQPKTLDALNSRLTINTQYIFFNVLYDIFLSLLLLLCPSTWTCSSICSFLETSR